MKAHNDKNTKRFNFKLVLLALLLVPVAFYGSAIAGTTRGSLAIKNSGSKAIYVTFTKMDSSASTKHGKFNDFQFNKTLKVAPGQTKRLSSYARADFWTPRVVPTLQLCKTNSICSNAGVARVHFEGTDSPKVEEYPAGSHVSSVKESSSWMVTTVTVSPK